VRSLSTDLALSPRQRQIVRCLWGGLGDAEIAALLGISAITVHGELAEAYRRLGVSGRGDPRTLAAVWLWEDEHGTDHGATGRAQG
jgi:DNA-binding NarL/FixJ family response regulator